MSHLPTLSSSAPSAPSTPDRTGLVRGTTGAMSFNSFTSLISQTTPAEERMVREQQHQLEAGVAQRVRRAMLVGPEPAEDTAPQRARPPLYRPASPSLSSVGPLDTATPRKEPNVTTHNNAGIFQSHHKLSLSLPNAPSSPNLINATPRAMSPSPTFTTLGGSTGNVVPTGYTETDGMLVCLEALRTVQSRKKNASPFDANKYYPMLPPPEGPARNKILLCLDIDETMLHSTAVAPTNPATPRADVTAKYDVRVPVETPDGSEFFIGVNVRPFLREFIEAVSPLFDVAIFTASQSNYANLVLHAIDRDRKLFGPITKRLFREHCAESNGCRVKDLSLLGRPLDRVVLLDNSPATYSFQPRNAIPISSYFEGGGDNELQKLLPLMRRLASAKSVYSVLDPYNAFLITPEPDEVLTMASPLSTSPVSLCRSTSFHSPRGVAKPTQSAFDTPTLARGLALWETTTADNNSANMHVHSRNNSTSLAPTSSNTSREHQSPNMGNCSIMVPVVSDGGADCGDEVDDHASLASSASTNASTASTNAGSYYSLATHKNKKKSSPASSQTHSTSSTQRILCTEVLQGQEDRSGMLIFAQKVAQQDKSVDALRDSTMSRSAPTMEFMDNTHSSTRSVRMKQ